MKQALEAMERIKSYGNIFMYRKTERNPYDQAVEAITALRQAIAEAEKQEPVGYFSVNDYGNWEQNESNYGTPLYAAPVHASDISQEPVDKTAKDQHELAGTIPISNGGIATSTPTDFFAPPKREWVGLTDGDVHDAFNFVEFVKQISFDRDRPEWCENFAAYLEAKLKEKNHG
jgi:hypothetical protein